MATPFDQSRYQVRFEWGAEGIDRLATADIVVVVDVLRFSSTVAARVAGGQSVRLDEAAHAVSRNGAAVANRAGDALIVLGCLRNAQAVARAVLAYQHDRGARTSIAVIAAGEREGRDGPVRFAVEDQLGAGAIIDALGQLGIDHTSPEAAITGEAFRGLRPALRHLLTASGSGQELIDGDRRDEVLAASVLDDLDVVPVLRAGAFVAW